MGCSFSTYSAGPDASDLQKEKTKLDGFTYIWDQAEFEPVTSRIVCHIHFKFPDGSKIKRAFTYDWRLWTLPEFREILTEAGFAKVRVYWEGTDDDGEGNGEFTEHRDGRTRLCLDRLSRRREVATKGSGTDFHRCVRVISAAAKIGA